MHVHVLPTSDSTGLANDKRLLDGALRALGVRVLDFPHPGYAPRSKRFRLKRLVTPSLWPGRYDANVFLERIDARWFPAARRQLLVPNQEWLRDACRALLPRIDLVLCKTRHAEAIFRALGCRTIYTSFTSLDRAATCGAPRYPELAHYAVPRILHVAGSSTVKGTGALLRAWSRHPQWPELTVLLRPQILARLDAPMLANVRYLMRTLEESELDRLMVEHNVHLCPSEAEGWGHNVAEALGCAAAVLTTDAPPMNELVTAERGVLVPASSSAPMRSGTRYRVDADALEDAIEGLLRASAEQRRALGHAARRWYEWNAGNFAAALGEVFVRSDLAR